MRATGCFFFLFLIFFSSFSSYFSLPPSNAEASFIAPRQLFTLLRDGDLPDNYVSTLNLNISFPNPRLKGPYIALQAWKEAIYSDPFNTTKNWVGPDVCSYNGVFCAPALDDPNVNVVAGIDLNNADISGHFPSELGLLTDLALFHVNSNRFCGILPKSFSNLKLLFELDVSNNRLVGPFPECVLSICSLRYLDLRYNNFEGELPDKVFEKDFDAIFLNNNRFMSTIPETLGSSKASVIVFANNNFTGCIPSSIGKMSSTLNEIVFSNNFLTGCLPPEIGMLANLTVFDIENNLFTGPLPKALAGLETVEELAIARNNLTGFVVEELCSLISLKNFSFSHNYFNGEAEACEPRKRGDIDIDDSNNCLPDKTNQKSDKQCKAVVSRPVDCSKSKCAKSSSSPNLKPQTPREQPIEPESPEKRSPPPPPPLVESPPPPLSSPPPPSPPLVQSPSPPSRSLQPPSDPYPAAPPISENDVVILPPTIGFQYASPPPPIFPGY